MRSLSIVPSAAVSQVLAGQEQSVVECVRQTYLRHAAGATVNPDSYFLRFPGKPDSRIIALPAFLDGGDSVAGLKWVSSFPANVARGWQRASALLILNDYATGYPVAVLEGAVISAARTAASAALAAQTLLAGEPQTVGVVGAGVIARAICRFLDATLTPLRSVICHDVDAASARALTGYLDERGNGPRARSGSLDQALDADLVVFATTALTPYIPATRGFRPGQVILNISLRDLAPEILLGANNVLDDVEHCLKERTSPHLAEALSGGRQFVTGTLADIISGTAVLDPGQPTIFSPFGLGVLDLAVGLLVLRRATASGLVVQIPDFLGDQRRWPSDDDQP